MFAKKFAIVGVTAGFVALSVAIVTTVDDHSPASGDSDLAPGILLDDASGIGSIEDVVSFFELRSAERPNDYLTRTQLARALSAQARQTADLAIYEDAEVAARDALRLQPDDAAAKLELASALHSLHRFTEALDIGTDVLAENPSSLDALYVVSDANFELGNYALAADDYRRLEASGRNAAVVSRLARSASVEGDNDRAADLAEEAEKLSGAFSLRPNAKAFYPFQSGHFRFEAGDVDGAIEALNHALEIDPEHAGAREKLAGIHAATGNLNEAMDLYESLIASGPAADLYGSYADLLRATGDGAKADEQDALGLTLARETIDSFPAERRHLAGFFFTRDPRVALQLAEADIIERQDAGGYDTLAWALHLNGRDAEAKAAIDEALAIGTNTAQIRFHAGAIAAALGDTTAAFDHLSAALDINEHFAFGDAAAASRLVDDLRG